MSRQPKEKSALLENLRNLQGILKAPPQKKRVTFSAHRPGIISGGLTQLTSPAGQGKTSAALKFLSEHPKFKTVWIEEVFSAYPVGMAQRGVDLKGILFLHTGAEPGRLLWAALETLRSGLFDAAVLSGASLSERDLLGLKVQAEKCAACVLLLTETPLTGWVVDETLTIRPRFAAGPGCANMPADFEIGRPDEKVSAGY